MEVKNDVRKKSWVYVKNVRFEGKKKALTPKMEGEVAWKQNRKSEGTIIGVHRNRRTKKEE